MTQEQFAKENCPMFQWVRGLAFWDVIAHLTFRWEASIPSTQRCFEKFMRLKLPGVSYFYAIEQNPNRLGNHVHCLMANTAGMSRQKAWDAWFKKYGRNRIEPVKNSDDVASYCSKYVTKELDTWWNVKLVTADLWHTARLKAGKLGA